MSNPVNPPKTPPSAPPLKIDATPHQRLAEISRVMARHFLSKQEIIRLLQICTVAGEHMVLIGPPGTAKSAMVRLFSRLLSARYFEYLLTRFTEPNELFGPVDIRAFREGTYRRRTEGMLPEAEIVFLDEVFKSNSAILNSLLTLLNERRFTSGGQVLQVPLLSLFGASNEVPNDDNLAAIFDRFLLRVVSNNLDSYHFQGLLTLGLATELSALNGDDDAVRPLLSVQDLLALRQDVARAMRFSEDFLSRYKGLIFQIRSEGISVSDRRVVKLLKLFAASAILDGRSAVNDSDLFVLKHVWNNLEQTELLERGVQAGQRGMDLFAHVGQLLARAEMMAELVQADEVQGEDVGAVAAAEQGDGLVGHLGVEGGGLQAEEAAALHRAGDAQQVRLDPEIGAPADHVVDGHRALAPGADVLMEGGHADRVDAAEQAVVVHVDAQRVLDGQQIADVERVELGAAALVAAEAVEELVADDAVVGRVPAGEHARLRAERNRRRRAERVEDDPSFGRADQRRKRRLRGVSQRLLEHVATQTIDVEDQDSFGRHDV